MPASAARIAANRANALRSTGPRTPHGKANSAQNARKHGLLARTHTLPPERLPAAHQYAQHIASTAPHPDLAPLYYLRAILHHRHIFFRQSSQAYFNLYYSQPNRATWAAKNIHLLHALNAYFGTLSRQISRCNKLIFQIKASLESSATHDILPEPRTQPRTEPGRRTGAGSGSPAKTPSNVNEPNAPRSPRARIAPRRRRQSSPLAQTRPHFSRHCKRTQSHAPPPSPKPA